MRKLIATEWMSLDGVVQSPSYPDEDPSDGFERGGWHARYFDDVSMGWVIETVTSAGGYLLGRGTYEIFAAHWPNASAQDDLLDELRVMIDPLVVGAGKRLFGHGSRTRPLRLVESQSTSTGSLLVTYIAERKENES